MSTCLGSLMILLHCLVIRNQSHSRLDRLVWTNQSAAKRHCCFNCRLCLASHLLSHSMKDLELYNPRWHRVSQGWSLLERLHCQSYNNGYLFWGTSFTDYQGLIYWGEEASPPPKKFSQLQFKIMALRKLLPASRH